MLPLLNLHPGMGQRVSVGVFLQPPLPILVLWVVRRLGQEVSLETFTTLETCWRLEEMKKSSWLG